MSKLIAPLSCLFVLLYLPALYLSYNTGFAFIDDYESLEFARNVFASFNVFVDWFLERFSPLNAITPGQRWRPLYEFEVGLKWIFFEGDAGLHHISRFVWKLGTAGFIWLIIGSLKPWFKQTSILAVCAVGLFLLFPNNPEARLVPLELQLGFFMSSFIWCMLKTVILEQPGESRSKKYCYMTLLGLSAFGMVVAKEQGYTLIAPAIGILLISNKSIRSKVAIGSILTAVILYGYFKLHLLGGGKDFQPGHFVTLLSNLFNPFRVRWLMFAFIGYFLLVQLLALYSMIRSKQVRRPPGLLYLLLASTFLFYCLEFHFFPNSCLRYLYPASWMLSLLLTMPVVLCAPVIRDRVNRIAVTATLVIVLTSYHGFVFQFYSHYIVRRSENELIQKIELLQERGERVWIEIVNEPTHSIKARIKDLPIALGLKSSPLLHVGRDGQPKQGDFIVKPQDQKPTDEVIFVNGNIELSRAYQLLSSWHSFIALGNPQLPLYDCAAPYGFDIGHTIVKRH